MPDYIENSIADRVAGAHGDLVNIENCDVEDNLLVEDVAGIGVGLMVSRGTIPDRQALLGGDASGFAISVRKGQIPGALGAEATNLPVYEKGRPIALLLKGDIKLQVSGTANAGATNFIYNDTTGVISIGTAGAGSSTITGLTLMQSVTTSGLVRVKVHYPTSV